MALINLLEALNIEKSVYGENGLTTTTTLLNISAVYSKMGQHETAIEYSKAALEVLQQVPIQVRDASFYSNLTIAHYNIAAECEHLQNRGDDVASHYKFAMQTANAKLGPTHSLSKRVSQSYFKARNTVSEKLMMQAKRNSRTSVPRVSLSTTSKRIDTKTRNHSCGTGKYGKTYLNQNIIQENKYNFYYRAFAEALKLKKSRTKKSLQLANNSTTASLNRTRVLFAKKGSVEGARKPSMSVKNSSTLEYKIISGLRRKSEFDRSRISVSHMKTFIC